jgi:protein-tyrosine phosphatase
MAESLALCRLLAEDGVATAVATPHQLGRFTNCNKAAEVREAVRRLNETLRNDGVPLRILAGGEVHVDERVCRLVEEDEIVTLADGGRYLLLELPCKTTVDITPLLIELMSVGVQCVVSHVERIAPFIARRRMLLQWTDHGAHLQITASGLVGDFGPEVQKVAWSLLSSGWVTLVATDSHGVDFRPPRMASAFDRIRTRLGTDIAHRLCIENPSRVVRGQAIAPVLLCDFQEVER